MSIIIISRDRGMVVCYERVGRKKRRIWSFVPGPDGSVPYHTAPALDWSDDQRRRLERQARVVALAHAQRQDQASGAPAQPMRPPRAPRSARVPVVETALTPSQAPITPPAAAAPAVPFPPVVLGDAHSAPVQAFPRDISDMWPIAFNAHLAWHADLIQRWRAGRLPPAEARSFSAYAHAAVRAFAADFGYIPTVSDAGCDDNTPIVVLPISEPPAHPSACA